MNTEITYCPECKQRNDPKAYFLKSRCTCPKGPGNKNAQFPPNFDPMFNLGASRFTKLPANQRTSLHLCQFILNPSRNYRHHQKTILRSLINTHSITVIYVPHHLHLIRRLKKEKRICKQFKEAHIKVKHYPKSQFGHQNEIIARIAQFLHDYHL